MQLFQIKVGLCKSIYLFLSKCPVFVFVFSGKYLRQKRIDFQLPYDILWLWKHDQVICQVISTCCCSFFQFQTKSKAVYK